MTSPCPRPATDTPFSLSLITSYHHIISWHRDHRSLDRIWFVHVMEFRFGRRVHATCRVMSSIKTCIEYFPHNQHIFSWHVIQVVRIYAHVVAGHVVAQRWRIVLFIGCTSCKFEKLTRSCSYIMSCSFTFVCHHCLMFSRSLTKRSFILFLLNRLKTRRSTFRNPALY